MSMHLEFEPHSWYMHFAIKHNPEITSNDITGWPWEAYTDNGNTYQIDKLWASKLTDLKAQIKQYRKREAARTAEIYARLEATS